MDINLLLKPFENMMSNLFKSIIIFQILFYGCNFNSIENKIKHETLISISQNVWNDLGIEASTGFEAKNNSLTINIKYIDEYFLFDETNHLINSYLLYSLDSLITYFDTIIVVSNFDKLTDILEVKYHKDHVKKIQEEAASNQLFINMVKFTLNGINNYDEVGFEDLINDLKELTPDEFQHQGSFWVLLYNYSLNCCDSTSIAYKSMHVLNNAAHYPKRPWRPEILDSLINYCEGIRKSQNH
jgi:hypothetical protein